MEKILIDGKGVKVVRIVAGLKKSPCYGSLYSDISSLRTALLLEDRDGSWGQIKLGLMMGSVTVDEALTKILNDWILENSETATLGKLITALQNNGKKDFANYIKEEFKTEIEAVSSSSAVSSDGVPGGSRGAVIRNPHDSHISYIPTASDAVYLDFGNNLDVKQDVLPRVQLYLTQALTLPRVNKNIILQLQTLNIFDTAEISPLLGEFRDEQDRILELLRLFHNRGSRDIKICLEKLCNLDDLNVNQSHFRDYFNKNFPGSVKKCIN